MTAIFHARNSPAPHAFTSSNKAGIRIKVKPPPRLPHPPTKALAVPTILTLNMADVQNWQGIKQPPSTPIHSLSTMSPIPLRIRPEKASGIEPAMRRVDIIRLGPNLSQSGPTTIRTNIVAEMLAVPEWATITLERWSSFLMVGMRGWIPNQAVKAMKKQNQAVWNPRMCGLAILNKRNDLALPSSSLLIVVACIFFSTFEQQLAPVSAILTVHMYSDIAVKHCLKTDKMTGKIIGTDGTIPT